MNEKLTLEYSIPEENKTDITEQLGKADKAYELLLGSKFGMTGWIDYPGECHEELFTKISEMAENIRSRFSAVVVIGIGGSYLGAKAALDFMSSDEGHTTPKILFAGLNLDTDSYEKIFKEIEDEETAFIIISKSGQTTETIIAGNLFLKYIENKYGKDDIKERFFIVTDPDNGKLRKLADEKGYQSLPIPPDVGGRYSVLTAVGLLPMAIAGFDIRRVIRGAESAMKDDLIGEAKRLAAVRNVFEKKGYTVELFASFDSCISNVIHWIKQLYGESEGKEGLGMIPVDMEYTKDLHSLGQFVQEGRQIFTETVISVENRRNSIILSKEWGISGRDMTLCEYNEIAEKGTIAAHKNAGIPIFQIRVPDRSEYSFGQMIYFFQMSCAIRGVMMGVDPFNQPGVEKYKTEIKKNLK